MSGQLDPRHVRRAGRSHRDSIKGFPVWHRAAQSALGVAAGPAAKHEAPARRRAGHQTGPRHPPRAAGGCGCFASVLPAAAGSPCPEVFEQRAKVRPVSSVMDREALHGTWACHYLAFWHHRGVPVPSAGARQHGRGRALAPASSATQPPSGRQIDRCLAENVPLIAREQNANREK